MFKPVDPKPDFPKVEEKILAFWKKNKIFEKSIKQRLKENSYSFYDGPPFVTGLPHYGTLLPSIAKDVIPRYQTMKGKRVRRVWGWDCHGLPIENKVEEKIGLKNRKDILKFGINKFIAECRRYVEETSSEWKWYVDHIARWVDFDNAYRTMDLSYMETVIWVFKQLYDKGLIYKGNRVSLFCPRCSTPISNFEIAMDNSYTMMQDPAITIKFKLKNGKFKDSFILAWTTTPWTLPSNRALVVDPKEKYVMVETPKKEDCLILAKKRLKNTLAKEKFKVKKEFQGRELIGLSYEPLYTFVPANKNDFKIYAFEDMVNMAEGTGVVHSAPGFGEIDTEMGKHFDLTLMFTVDDEGKFVDKVKKWAGVYVKDADKEIIEDLSKRNLLFKKETITHRYPYCYRCETPLIYKAQESWFIDVKRLKKQLLKTNKKINWVPGHFKYGRFKKGIETAPDWCISRSRYWATIMPIWQCQKCQQIKVVGSIKEIEKLSGEKVTDLHRSGVDHLIFKCEKCKGVMKRIPEVLDCWVESGSMPYGERHYPFKNKKEFEHSFPADYIIEYVAHVRAWFYVMHVVSNALMGSHCFKNVIVTGTIAGTDGRKMSKSYGNFPDPKAILKRYGGDALRLYLMGSVIMFGRDMNITKGEEIVEQIKTVLLPLWNSYKFLVTFANLHDWKPSKKFSILPDSSNRGSSTSTLCVECRDNSQFSILDQWILARLSQFNKEFTGFMDAYHIPQATHLIKEFIGDLSRWYIRRSRERFSQGDEKALAVLYHVLTRFSLVAAPIIPFITEEIYKNLTSRESVHLEDWPEAGRINQKLLTDMEQVRKIIELGHSSRKLAGIKVRQPLKQLTIKKEFEHFGSSSSEVARRDSSDGGTTEISKNYVSQLEQLIREELNVKEIEWVSGKSELRVELDTKITPKLKAEGEARELVRKIQVLRKKAGCKLDEKIIIYAPSWPKEFEDCIKNKTLAQKIAWGKSLKISTC